MCVHVCNEPKAMDECATMKGWVHQNLLKQSMYMYVVILPNLQFCPHLAGTF